MIRIWTLLVLACLGTAFLAQDLRGPVKQAPRPALPGGDNVLVFLMDDAGVDMIERYGVDPALTPGLMPNFEALMDQGILFENAWAGPTCSPSRAALLTGNHSFRTGIGTVVGFGFSLPLATITLPELLRASSPHAYSSAAFGKWHLERRNSPNPCPPIMHGFDYFAGTIHPLTSAAGYCSWMQTICTPTGSSVVPQTEYMPSRVFDDALAWIQARTGPWFCYMAPQVPYEVHHVPPPTLQGVVSGNSCDPCANQRDCYEASLQAFDILLGDMLAGLGPTWMEDTTVIVVGDNGTPPDVAQLFATAKGTVFEGGVRVPFVVAGAAVDPALWNTRSPELVHIADLFQTVATIAGIDTLPSGSGLDSLDLTSLFNGGLGPRTQNYTEIFSPNGFGPKFLYKAAERDPQYKLVYDCVAGMILGLYDLQVDPLEATNLASPPPAPGTPEGDAVLRLRDDLLRRAQCAGDGAAPVVSKTNLAVGETRAILAWTTDEPSTSRTDLGPTSSYGTTLYDPALVTDHLVILGGLASDADYHAMLASWDTTGYMFVGDDIPFHTLPFVGQLPVSDPFGGDVNTSLWSFINPLGDAAINTTSTQVEIDVPGSTIPHNATGAVNYLPRLRQVVSDVDFEVEATFDSPLNADFQSQGILIEQDALRVLRIELHHLAGGTSVAAVSTRTGMPKLLAVDTTPLVPPMTVRCTRVGDTFTVSYSLDGVNFTPLTAFVEPMIVSGVSVFAGCAGDAAHAAVIDAFVETSAP